MTITATQSIALTNEDVKAILKADSVIFRHYKGRTTIEAVLREGYGGRRIFTAVEQRLFQGTTSFNEERNRVIEVEGSVYSYEVSRDVTEAASAFAMVHSAQHAEVWKTIASFLHAGDEVRLRFIADGQANGYVKDAGLHADEVRLEITRGKRKMTFLVDVSVTADNTARMVKRLGGV